MIDSMNTARTRAYRLQIRAFVDLPMNVHCGVKDTWRERMFRFVDRHCA